MEKKLILRYEDEGGMRTQWSGRKKNKNEYKKMKKRFHFDF